MPAHDQLGRARPPARRARGRSRSAQVDGAASRRSRAPTSRGRSSSITHAAASVAAPGRPRRCGRRPPRSGPADGRVGEAQRALPALDQEVRALHEHHAALGRAGGQRGDVGALGQVDPEEVAALGRDVAGLGQLPVERGAGGVAALAQRRLDGLDRAVDRARVAELGDDRLGDHVRRDVRLGGALADRRDQLLAARRGSRPGCPGRPSSRTTRRRPPAAALVERRASWAAARPRSAARRRGRPRRSVKSYSRASSSSRWRFSSESVQPAGFWKLGMMWASLGRAPSSSAGLERPDVDAVRLERDRQDLGAELGSDSSVRS